MRKATIVLLLSVVMLPATAARAEPREPFSIAVLGDSRGGLFDAFTTNLRSIYQADPRPIGLLNTGDITPDGAPMFAMWLAIVLLARRRHGRDIQ